MTGEKRNVVGARKEARAILSCLGCGRGGGGPLAYQYDAVFQVNDSRFDPDAAKGIVEAAKAGDHDARAALHLAIAWMLRERAELPDPLRQYLIDLLVTAGGPHKRGRRAHEHHVRNSVIALAVKAVMGHGFDHRRNQATDGPSACSIVAEALADVGIYMTEANIGKLSRPRAT